MDKRTSHIGPLGSSINGVRHGRTRAERSEAFTRVLHKRGTLRVHEQQAAYAG